MASAMRPCSRRAITHFAAAHIEPAHALLVLPLGLWFGWLRQRTDSLWPSLVAHIVNNGLAVVAAALIDK